MITTQKDLRKQFWEKHPFFTKKGKTKQSGYTIDIRMAWCDFVEDMRRSGQISETLSMMATL